MTREQSRDDDAISRDATVKQLCRLGNMLNKKRDAAGDPYIMAALYIQDNKDDFPSVTPSRLKGYWIPIPYELDYGSDARCSNCHEDFIDAVDYKYCPNCGAEMEEKQCT